MEVDDRRQNKNMLDVPTAGEAVRKVSGGSKSSQIDTLAGGIIRDHAYVKPFENVLNEGSSKVRNGDDAEQHRAIEIQLEAAEKRRHQRQHNALQRRRLSSIFSLVFAVVGILLMVILNEWTFNQTFTDEGTDIDVMTGYGLLVARVIRCLIIISTAALLASIIIYYISDLQIYMHQQGIDDWRIAISKGFVVKLLIELIICSICPIPGNFYFWWWTTHYDGAIVTQPRVPLDILLSIPMFFRFYLVPRVLLLWFPLFSSTRTKVIASMNSVKFTLGFVVKALATLYPAISLLIFALTYVTSASYVTRLCERYHYLDSNQTVIVEAKRFTNYLNNVWYIGITFLTIGYGDIVVNTYCGRAVGFLTGMLGVATTALIINVVAAKMRLSDGESRVFEFVGSHSLIADLRHAAANVIRETWYIHKYRKAAAAQRKMRDKGHLRLLQRRFIEAVKQFRRLEILRRQAATETQPKDLPELCQQNQQSIDGLRAETSESLKTVQASLQECNASLQEYNAQLAAIRSALYMITNQPKIEVS